MHVSERFLLESGIRYKIFPGTAISPRECILFALQFFQRKRPENFTCLRLFDVITYFNVVFQNSLMRNSKLENAAQRAYLC